MNVNDIDYLIENLKFEEAKSKLQSFERSLQYNTDLDSTKLLLLKVSCFKIDIGSSINDEILIKEALDFLETEKEYILKFITKSSYFYNLANGLKAKFEIQYFKNEEFITPQKIKDYSIQPAIDSYWKSYKYLSEIDKDLKPQLFINFSLALEWVGRKIESLQFLDLALREKPDKIQAHSSRGDALSRFEKETPISVSVAFYAEIYNNLIKVVNNRSVPTHIQNAASKQLEYATSRIKEFGFRAEDIPKEIQLSKKEFRSHSEYRRFTLNHFLSLNEHSLYCNCNASSKDDLRIGTDGYVFPIDEVGKMELVLNRIKSEFAIARYLLYQGTKMLIPDDLDIGFSELNEGEILNSNFEAIRLSYRTCYGILDKIAKGTCKIFKLANDNEDVLFEAFWNPRNESRWNKINAIKNRHLTALYSIACDLNTRSGEMKEFKEWRNGMEHDILIVKNTKEYRYDFSKLFNDDFIKIVDESRFRAKAMHLIQIVRASIYHFTYMIRTQTASKFESDKNYLPINFK